MACWVQVCGRAHHSSMQWGVKQHPKRSVHGVEVQARPNERKRKHHIGSLT